MRWVAIANVSIDRVREPEKKHSSGLVDQRLWSNDKGVEERKYNLLQLKCIRSIARTRRHKTHTGKQGGRNAIIGPNLLVAAAPG